MFDKIKEKIDKRLAIFINKVNERYRLKDISPLLFNNIKDFTLRDGKRIRPILFVIGYQGYCSKECSQLYSGALAFELLHDFLLIHDDIIDKSNLRRGKPAMHAMLNNYLKKEKGPKFSGQDLSIVAGDILYAIAIDAFLMINEDKNRKEKALRQFIQSAIYTGSGEFIELLCSIKEISNISQKDIYKIYDLKTAHYTFSCPLSIGALLAGASDTEIKKITLYGLYLGRAFQIKDDILGMFSDEEKIGKSELTDLQEAKRTILIWHAYKNSTQSNKKIINKTFAKKVLNKSDLLKMRKLITQAGTLIYAKQQVNTLLRKAQDILSSLTIKETYKKELAAYTEKILKL